MNFSLPLSDLLSFLQTLPSEALELVFLIGCGGVILGMMRFYGAVGLMFYSAIAVIVGNFQVQLAAFFSFFTDPIALGTVVFSSTFIVSSILTEYYGKKEAQKAIWLSFSGMIILSFFMFLTLGFNPAHGFQDVYEAMRVLFLPVPALIAASLIAYVVGQYNDIWIFAAVSKLTRGRLLWLRSSLAIGMGMFLDSLIFSVLAWIVFAPVPLEWETVFYTYVLGTYILRLGVGLIGIPFIYLARYAVR